MLNIIQQYVQEWAWIEYNDLDKKERHSKEKNTMKTSAYTPKKKK